MDSHSPFKWLSIAHVSGMVLVRPSRFAYSHSAYASVVRRTDLVCHRLAVSCGGGVMGSVVAWAWWPSVASDALADLLASSEEQVFPTLSVDALVYGSQVSFLSGYP